MADLKAKPSKLVAVPLLKEARSSLHSQSSHSSSFNSPQTSPPSTTPSSLPDRSRYDVYATPFVPEALRAINHDQAYVIAAPAKHYIDFESYTSAFVRHEFANAPGTSLASLLAANRDRVLSPALNEETYARYFLRLWGIECVATEVENDSYSLYNVPLCREDDIGAYTLSIPGLREDSPLIEMGDVVQLRQLWLDAHGNLAPMAIHTEDPMCHGTVVKTWGGLQYNATVSGVKRAQEIVYLRVLGLDNFHRAALNFNVVFPLKQKVLNATQRSLEFVYRELSCNAGGLDGAENIKIDQVISQEASPNKWLQRMLFPIEAYGVLQTKLRTVPFRRGLFDSALNYEQLQAVDMGCRNAYGTLPFLISGPPGTGKTKTLVELTLQLLNTTNIKHVLICAPSNQAADTLALRLKTTLSSKQLLRLNGPSRSEDEVPSELSSYCYMEDNMFYLPPFRRLMAFNVVVTSTRDASLLVNARLTNIDIHSMETNILSAFHPEDSITSPPLHWGALLMDEAAQATELDILPAFNTVCPPGTYPSSCPQPRFFMAGDQNQLGPRVASRDPQLSTSLFARLFDRPLYASHPLSRSKAHPSTSPPVLKSSMLPMLFPPFTNLIRNYRSHPSILSVPSSLFYNDTLIPEAPTPDTPLQYSRLWRGRKWPVLFVPHFGIDDIERDGGGWYNITEAHRACDIAQCLVTESRVRQSDIIIMSPFAAQVKRLRTLIRSAAYGGGSGLWSVNIGPLEAFQGLEGRVVIICTTRTRKRFLESDAQRNLGLIGAKRKMNVAITRAKEALFVIGSPDVLRLDKHWLEFLAFCWRNGLVEDPEIKFDKLVFKHDKIGVLEKALIVKEEQRNAPGKALGSAAPIEDIVNDDELWAYALGSVVKQEDSGEAEEPFEGSDEDGEDIRDQGHGDQESDDDDASSTTIPVDKPRNHPWSRNTSK